MGIILIREQIGLFVKGDDIDLYVLGLQEIIDLSSPTEALRPFSDPSIPAKWKRALLEALPPGYKVVAEQVRNSLWCRIFEYVLRCLATLWPSIGHLCLAVTRSFSWTC